MATTLARRWVAVVAGRMDARYKLAPPNELYAAHVKVAATYSSAGRDWGVPNDEALTTKGLHPPDPDDPPVPATWSRYKPGTHPEVTGTVTLVGQPGPSATAD
jgi:hypothetical protein